MQRRRASDEDVHRVLVALLRNDAPLRQADPIIAERVPRPTTLGKTFNENDLKVVVGERIREARHHRRWSRGDLALATRMSETFLGRLESGTAGLSLFVAARVARALGIMIGVLVRRDD